MPVVLVGLAEATVDDDELAAALDGALPLLGLDGDVAVDDVAVGPSRPNSFRSMSHTAGSW